MKRALFFVFVSAITFMFSPLYGKNALQGEVKTLYNAYKNFYNTTYSLDSQENQPNDNGLAKMNDCKVLQGEVKTLYNAYKNFYTRAYSLKKNNKSTIIQIAAKESRGSFLNKPGRRMRKIKNVLLAASQKIVDIQSRLDDIIAKIISNERKLSHRPNRARAHKLVSQNIAFFKKIEQLRLAIAEIQLKTAQKILRIEKNGYNTVVYDVRKQLAKIKNNPARYWIWRRRQLLTHSEQNSTLSIYQLRRLYKNK